MEKTPPQKIPMLLKQQAVYDAFVLDVPYSKIDITTYQVRIFSHQTFPLENQ
jgi:hypothetical protein